MKASGKCQCGAVAFTMTFPSKWVAHCHCTKCQSAHGAAFVTWVSAAESQVTIADPSAALKWYQSSEKAQRGFCSECGSMMFFRSSQWPGELHMTRANFTEPVDRLPQVHAFHDTHVDWLTIEDALPKRVAPGA